LIVNATPVSNELLVQPEAGQTVVELAYAEGETALVRAAREAGCAVIDGREALVLQGVPAFERWTGVPAPVDAMRTALGLEP
jgi:shikimate dehydrogenase